MAGATPWPLAASTGRVSGKDQRNVKTTSMTLLAALALGALSPSLATAQAAKPAAHSATAGKPLARKVAAKKGTGKKTQKKATCRNQFRQGKKVRVCK